VTNQRFPLIGLTRPAGGNAHLAEQILAQYPGCRVVDWPLLMIEAMPDLVELRAHMGEITATDWLVFVSPRAVQYAHALTPLEALPAKHWAAVGQATAAVLRNHQVAGSPDIIVPSATQDSEGLLAVLPRSSWAGQRVWIVRGETGRETLADGLRARGATVRYLPVYRRCCAPAASDWDRVDLPTIWVITAPESLNCLHAWGEQMLAAGQREGLLHSGLVVINERTEAKARALGFTGAIVRAANPDDRALAQACSDRSLFQAG